MISDHTQAALSDRELELLADEIDRLLALGLSRDDAEGLAFQNLFADAERPDVRAIDDQSAGTTPRPTRPGRRPAP